MILLLLQVTDQMYRNTLSLTSYFDIIEKDFGIKWSKTQWKDLLKPLYSAIAARLFIQVIRDQIVEDRHICMPEIE